MMIILYDSDSNMSSKKGFLYASATQSGLLIYLLLILIGTWIIYETTGPSAINQLNSMANLSPDQPFDKSTQRQALLELMPVGTRLADVYHILDLKGFVIFDRKSKNITLSNNYYYELDSQGIVICYIHSERTFIKHTIVIHFLFDLHGKLQDITFVLANVSL